MPTPTDLVTDLPADFEVFGQAVATSLADLLGGTTGQVLSKTTNADMDFTWVAANPGDITGVTAGTGISGGGTSGTVTVTNDMATTITASGDIVVGTGSGTYDNLPIGTTNQVLTADTTVSPYKVKWATASSGGMTELGTTTLSGTSYTFSAIPQSGYRQLYLEITGPNSATTFDLNVELQQTDGTGGNEQYCVGHYYISGGSYTTFTNGNTKEKIRLTYPGSSRADYSYLSNHAITFYNYWNQRATYIVSSGYQNNSSNRIVFTQMGANELSNIYNIKINSSQTLTGGTATLWGVK
jgi:hypothetical protein